ncbi:glycosyltransferase family 2 protein [Propioniciclava sp.]|uniref:GtrA family protein n=1 Tax=Propioniciclava sp. TaxID=2038686 RepID=UPI0026301356|nr:glycosyltransferase family 2 protein [Propioniciclava sp.]
MLVLIPAYEPDLRLVQLVRDLGVRLPGATVLIVDDGSGPAYDGVFEVARAAGAQLLRYTANLGKGAALKHGFAWASEHAPGEPVVCADCDGQHTPADIARVAALVEAGTMVLGGRRFTGAVPVRSRVGNTVSRWLFRAVAGSVVHDTQTGLRAYPGDLLEWLQGVPGDRFEYEFSLLLRASSAGVRIVEVPIETIYLDDNASSHFRPVRDSLRIYAPLLRFAASSLAGYLIDVVLLLGLVALGIPLVGAVVSARVVSAVVNFTINREVVFGHEGDRRDAALRYAALAAALLGANVVLMAAFVTAWGMPLVLAKVLVEAGLFVVSYGVQNRFVFPSRRAASAVARPEVNA